MKANIFFLVFGLLSFIGLAQNNKETALSKAKEAIKIIDEGKIDEGIKILTECAKLDPDNFIYPYEIAYAFMLQKNYEKAIDKLEKLKTHKSACSEIYQSLGNCYIDLNKEDEAIKTYDEGIKLFPKSAVLYTEKGNLYVGKKNYSEAILNYERGIEVNPSYPSNYYRLATLFLNSNDKLSGLIYGEIFINLERKSQRTKEISELLYNTYKSAIKFEADNKTSIDFCQIVMDGNDILKGDKMKMPFCMIFGKSFIMSLFDEKEINLNSLSKIRTTFIENFYKEDAKNYPNAVFEYHKKMIENKIFDAYNHYIFQMGAQEEFKNWLKDNKTKFTEFIEWYTKEDNYLTITEKNKFTR
ncbi:MAG: tetratricopeptide repeat protein [Limnohabitans sp.]|nr:tetratricopeptide repeat protein [Limnohabitans sp.]